jgi:hypothetical protein
MKSPVRIFGCWRGFSYALKMQSSHSGTKPGASGLPGMQWIEALINVSAFVGFVGIATHWPMHHPEP